MDPNAARARMIELANRCLAGQVGVQQEGASYVAIAIDLAEAVHDLDEWLRAQGFLPDVWALRDQNIGRRQAVGHVDIGGPTPVPKMVDDEKPAADTNHLCGELVWSSSGDSAHACSLDRGHSGPCS